MGHREDLLAGAKRCLMQHGYARTTARDIVTASGTNLASIGYHYGSKAALMNAAVIDALFESSEELGRSLSAETDPSADPLERFEAMWTRIITQFTSHRPLFQASFEIFVQADHEPGLREVLAEALQQGRAGMEKTFQELSDFVPDPEARQAVGSFYQALVTGVMAQWLVDPERAPTGHQLALAVQTMSTWLDSIGANGRPTGENQAGENQAGGDGHESSANGEVPAAQ
ncbi:TetR/AcrR family transcriptional regulator [Sphaerisporangium dianthi]|uniref:TetR/AcrR family transcriptional regulator n=1 Tax=Sphaerisporangium dianthi TaxID=1436120 RepID=A0ABV9CT63_9ACTN